MHPLLQLAMTILTHPGVDVKALRPVVSAACCQRRVDRHAAIPVSSPADEGDGDADA